MPVGLAGCRRPAAIEAGLAFALNADVRFGIRQSQPGEAGPESRNEFVGVRCGIMDQFANIFGRPGSVLKLDCRNLAYAYFRSSATTCASSCATPG